MNEKVKNLKTEILSDNWYTLKKITYDFLNRDGKWETQTREAYDRGNAATILLYNTEENTVILTRQFRLPSYINGNKSGMLIEACAGMLDHDSPEDCIRKEIKEETGYELKQVKKIFEAYMSPGSVTEILHFFIGEYNESMKTSNGGGLEDEQESIEVLEVPFTRAVEMVNSGEIKDAKTIMLVQYLQLHRIMEQTDPPHH
jgi:nudix-type nucleoside diphosphatase (YffH/AdpP family)